MSWSQDSGADVIARQKAVRVHGNLEAEEQRTHNHVCRHNINHGSVPQFHVPPSGAVLALVMLPCRASYVRKHRRRRVFHGSLCRNLPVVHASAVSEPWLTVAQRLHCRHTVRTAALCSVVKRPVLVEQWLKSATKSCWLMMDEERKGVRGSASHASLSS